MRQSVAAKSLLQQQITANDLMPNKYLAQYLKIQNNYARCTWPFIYYAFFVHVSQTKTQIINRNKFGLHF